MTIPYTIDNIFALPYSGDSIGFMHHLYHHHKKHTVRHIQRLRVELISLAFVMVIVLVIPLTVLVSRNNQDLRDRASSFPVVNQTTGKTAIISVSPSSTTIAKDGTTTISLVIDGGGQAFNAAQSTVTVSSNLQVQTVTPGDCNFTFITTPTVNNLSYIGAILGGSVTKCTLYTATVKGLSSGTGTITLTNNQVKAVSDSHEMFSQAINGTITITSTTPPTPTSIRIPTPTVTPKPTATPTPAKTATIAFTPSTSSVKVGSTFTTSLVIKGNGQAFNAAQSTVSYPSLIKVQNVTLGNCNFALVIQPTPSNLSYAGAILGGSTNSCTVYTVTFKAVSKGTATVSLTNNLVKSVANSSEIFKSATNGTYTITK